MIRQKARIGLLGFMGCSVLLVLARVVLTPAIGTPVRAASTPYAFPTTVPLEGWQSHHSRALPDLPNDRRAQKRLRSAKLYEYQKDNISLKIEMRYTTETSGNVIGFLNSYTPISTAVVQPALRDERHRQGVGYYVMYEHQQRAYLTSCINPKGGSTVTLPQFRRNRYIHDLRIERLFWWLVKGNGIRDDRCLWVNMSIPLNSKTQKSTADAVLESAWLSWFDWWQSRFPKS